MDDYDDLMTCFLCENHADILKRSIYVNAYLCTDCIQKERGLQSYKNEKKVNKTKQRKICHGCKKTTFSLNLSLYKNELFCEDCSKNVKKVRGTSTIEEGVDQRKGYYLYSKKAIPGGGITRLIFPDGGCSFRICMGAESGNNTTK